MIIKETIFDVKYTLKIKKYPNICNIKFLYINFFIYNCDN